MELKTNYINIATKKQIIDEICKNSIIESNGMKFIDYISRQIAVDVSLVSFYSNIDLETNNIDELYKNGTIEELRKSIPISEIDFIEKNVDYTLNQMVMTYNSIAGVINRNLQELINKLPTDKQIKSLSRSLIKDLNKLDWDKVPMLKQMLDVANGKQ